MSCRSIADYDKMDIQIADQTGRPIQLPAAEKKVNFVIPYGYTQLYILLYYRATFFTTQIFIRHILVMFLIKD